MRERKKEKESDSRLCVPKMRAIGQSGILKNCTSTCEIRQILVKVNIPASLWDLQQCFVLCEVFLFVCVLFREYVCRIVQAWKQYP